RRNDLDRKLPQIQSRGNPRDGGAHRLPLRCPVARLRMALRPEPPPRRVTWLNPLRGSFATLASRCPYREDPFFFVVHSGPQTTSIAFVGVDIPVIRGSVFHVRSLPCAAPALAPAHFLPDGGEVRGRAVGLGFRSLDRLHFPVIGKRMSHGTDHPAVLLDHHTPTVTPLREHGYRPSEADRLVGAIVADRV